MLMKLREIKWNNHPILGDLLLNFLIDDTACDTIVIAGENGTGKTTILETLYGFLNQGPITPFEYVEYQLDNGDIYRAYPIGGANKNYFRIKNCQTGIETNIESDRYNSSDKVKTKEEDPRHYGCAYTKARADYETQSISSISGLTVDDDIYKETGETKANRLKQLLIDVKNQDNNEFVKQNKDTGIGYSDFEPNSKFYRFSSAFNKFFDNVLTFNRVDTIKGVHEIFFKKHNKEIRLDDLSTGESQIVFRGTYLLQNVGKLNGSIIFIDEPEISMHPLWQEKILSYYKGIFTKDGKQNAQLIVATHSQGVISEALKDDKAKVIVLQCDDNGKIGYSSIQTPAVLNYVSGAEINYQAFGVASTDYHDALYGYIKAKGWMDDYKSWQGETEDYVQQNDDGSVKPVVKKCLSEKLRHMIHHPENRNNGTYRPEELEKSIEDMRNFILGKRMI